MTSPTIRLRVTERLTVLIERVWKAAPELRDDFPATVLNALALYAEYREGRPSLFGNAPSQQNQGTDQTANSPEAVQNSDDEWA